MGEKVLDYFYTSPPFIFGSAHSVEIPASKIILELQRLEKESKDFLFMNWVKDID